MDGETIWTAAALGLGAFAVLLVVVFILADRRHGQVARCLLGRWAGRNGYEFVTLEQKWFHLGPFWLRGGYAAVFRGTVVTPGGNRRTGYFRVGPFRGQIENCDTKAWAPDPACVSDQWLDEQIEAVWEK